MDIIISSESNYYVIGYTGHDNEQIYYGQHEYRQRDNIFYYLKKDMDYDTLRDYASIKSIEIYCCEDNSDLVGKILSYTLPCSTVSFPTDFINYLEDHLYDPVMSYMFYDDLFECYYDIAEVYGGKEEDLDPKVKLEYTEEDNEDILIK